MMFRPSNEQIIKIFRNTWKKFGIKIITKIDGEILYICSANLHPYLITLSISNDRFREDIATPEDSNWENELVSQVINDKLETQYAFSCHGGLTLEHVKKSALKTALYVKIAMVAFKDPVTKEIMSVMEDTLETHIAEIIRSESYGTSQATLV